MWATLLSPVILLFGAALALMKPFWVDSLGLGRKLEALNNANCRQIPELQACEDSWLHHDSGLLYLACSESVSSRSKYIPALTKFSSFEPPAGDYVAILDQKKNSIKKINVKGFHGNRGEGQFNLHGINVETLDSKEKPTLRVFLNNHRPTLGSKGNYINGNQVGSNSTIEIFETVLGSEEMNHIRTYSNSNHIRTPNAIASLDKNSFFFTNDHREKLGWKRYLDLIKPRGDVSFCNKKRCYPSALNLPGPNGLVRSRDDGNLFFLASSTTGFIRTLRLQEDNSLTVEDRIYTGYPADNLSVDESGAIWVTAFPKGLTTFAHLNNPHEVHSPTVVLRIRRNRTAGLKWIVEKMFEDDGKIASGKTDATYDIRTHQLYLSGILSPALTICQLP